MVAKPRSAPPEMPDILLVEDNPLHIRLVKSMLADVWPEPNNLRTARKLERAIAELRENRPDCVLLDLLLPDADGLEAVNAMLAVDHDVPIVVLSSHEDDELALQAVREGAQDYLVKGTVGPDSLARAIRFAIHRHRISRQDVGAPQAFTGPVSAGVAVVDDEGVVMSVQREVAEMLGIGVDTLVESKLPDMVHPNDVQMWNAALASARGGAVPEFSVRLRHASGNDIRIRMELTPLLAADGDSYLIRWYPLPAEGTVSSGGQYAVVTDWA